MAKIDVLIPVYNRPDLLPLCVEGILGQTFQDFNVIIYDDGSSCEYDLPKDSRIILQRCSTNRGVGYARNILLDMARSPLCCWQDSDDVPHPKRLQYLVDYMGEHPGIHLAQSYMFWFLHPKPHTATRTVYRIDPSRWPEQEGFRNNFAFATSVFRTTLRETYRFDPAYRSGGEDVRWVRGMVEDGCNFGIIPKPLYYCRRHVGRLTTLREARIRRRQGGKG